MQTMILMDNQADLLSLSSCLEVNLLSHRQMIRPAMGLMMEVSLLGRDCSFLFEGM